MKPLTTDDLARHLVASVNIPSWNQHVPLVVRDQATGKEVSVVQLTTEGHVAFLKLVFHAPLQYAMLPEPSLN